MQLPIDDIVVRRRVRSSLGDLTPLMESLRRHGLMNPIVINSQNELIAGQRRLEAARRLGWTSVTVRVMDKMDSAELLEMELDENLHRKSLSTEELAEAHTRLERLRNPGLLKRIFRAVIRFFQRLFGRTEAL